MRLADFILRDMEHIMAEWEAFAMTLLPAARTLDSLALRSSALEILQAVAKDLSTPQTSEAQRVKSLGRAPKLPGAAETAAQIHATQRARDGFEVNQLVRRVPGAARQRTAFVDEPISVGRDGSGRHCQVQRSD